MEQLEPYKTEIEFADVKVEIMFDGFCLTVMSESKYVFAASVNDPSVSDRGNACLLLFDPDELATRLDDEEETSDEFCLVRDLDYSICNLPRGHEGVVHQEVLEDGTLWAEWRSITKYSETNRAEKYLTPSERSPNVVKDSFNE